MQIFFIFKYLSVRKWTIAAISIFWMTINSADCLASPGSNQNQKSKTTTSETTTTTPTNTQTSTSQSNTTQTQTPKVKACLKDNSGVGNNLHDGQYQLSIDMGEGKEPYLIRIDPDNKAQMQKLEDYLFEQGLDENHINSLMLSIQDIEAVTNTNNNTFDICGEQCSLDGDYINSSALDLDSDGIPDEKEGLGDNDNDAIKNLLDSDFDGDGISDFMEAGFDIDQNKDGISDYQQPLDTDQDGVFDYKDSDSDNDGILDRKEYIANNNDCGINHDADNDGIYNFRDQDSDNDNLPDSVEAGPNPEEPQDTNNNGIPNFLETLFAD